MFCVFNQFYYFKSALQLGHIDFFSTQGTIQWSWKICLHLSTRITSPLVNPVTQIEHYLSVFPTFIFFILSIWIPIPLSAISRLSCSSRNATESSSINLWNFYADIPWIGDWEGAECPSYSQSAMFCHSFCQSIKSKLYLPLGLNFIGLSAISITIY